MWKDNISVRCLTKREGLLELFLYEHKCNLADITETSWEEDHWKSNVQITL